MAGTFGQLQAPNKKFATRFRVGFAVLAWPDAADVHGNHLGRPEFDGPNIRILFPDRYPYKFVRGVHGRELFSVEGSAVRPLDEPRAGFYTPMCYRLKADQAE